MTYVYLMEGSDPSSTGGSGGITKTVCSLFCDSSSSSNLVSSDDSPSTCSEDQIQKMKTTPRLLQKAYCMHVLCRSFPVWWVKVNNKHITIYCTSLIRQSIIWLGFNDRGKAGMLMHPGELKFWKREKRLICLPLNIVASIKKKKTSLNLITVYAITLVPLSVILSEGKSCKKRKESKGKRMNQRKIWLP